MTQTVAPTAIARTGRHTFALMLSDGQVIDGYRSRDAAYCAALGDVRGMIVATVRAILNDHTSTHDQYLFVDWAIPAYSITAADVR